MLKLTYILVKNSTEETILSTATDAIIRCGINHPLALTDRNILCLIWHVSFQAYYIIGCLPAITDHNGKISACVS